MSKWDLSNSSHVKGCTSKLLEVIDEDSEVFFNFIRTLRSDTTKKS